VGTRKPGRQRGNLNALKHGFYSKHFLKGEVLDVEAAVNLQEEIEMLRVVIRRLLRMARGCKDIGELANVLNTLGLPSTAWRMSFARLTNQGNSHNMQVCWV
jgi:hypothetical protein